MVFRAVPALIDTFDPRLATSLEIMNRLAKPAEKLTNRVKQYRQYFDGEQTDPLTTAQRDLLAEDIDYTLNICKTVVHVPANRLEVRAVEMPGAVDEARFELGDRQTTLSDEVNKTLRRVWDFNRMDEKSGELHVAAGRDGDAYLIADIDPQDEHRRVRYTVNPAFDGDTGVYAIYDDDPHAPIYFVKEWQITVDRWTKQKRQITRRNVYYPNRVEKWVRDRKRGKDWMPFDAENLSTVTTEDGVTYQTTVVWWTHNQTETGIPLGFPVLHFRCNSAGGAQGVSDLADVAPGVQDSINIAHAMISAAEQLQGTPVPVVFTDAELPDDLEWYPGSIVRVPGQGSVFFLPAADLDALNRSLDAKIRRAATLTAVPTYLFNLTGQIAAEGTQQQMEIMLLAKVKRRQVAFGNRYEDLARLTLKLMVAFDLDFSLLGEGEDALQRIDDLPLTCRWEPAEIRDENREIEKLGMKVEKLNVPRERVWQEAGYSPEEIAQMKVQQDNDTQVASALVAEAMLGVGSGNGASAPSRAVA